MNKLALLFILLISFVGFAQQKAKPFENVDDMIFQTHKNFLLDGEPDFCFMVIDLDRAEGASLSSTFTFPQISLRKRLQLLRLDCKM